MGYPTTSSLSRNEELMYGRSNSFEDKEEDYGWLPGKDFLKFGLRELLCGFVNVVTDLTFDFSADHLSFSLRYRARFFFENFRLVDIPLPEYRVL